MTAYTRIAALLAGITIGGVTAWQVQEWRHGEEAADLRRTYAEASLRAAKAEADKQAARIAALETEVQNAQDRAKTADADAVAARGAGERLRVQLAAARRSVCPTPATPNGGAPAGQTGDLLADVQRRLDEATDGIARFADASYNSAVACSSLYDSMR